MSFNKQIFTLRGIGGPVHPMAWLAQAVVWYPSRKGAYGSSSMGFNVFVLLPVLALLILMVGSSNGIK